MNQTNTHNNNIIIIVVHIYADSKMPPGACLFLRNTQGMAACDDVDNGLYNTCEVIRQETVLFSTPETDYIIYD